MPASPPRRPPDPATAPSDDTPGGAVADGLGAPVPAETEWAPGTHLVSPRRGYQHHGLYAGHGRVIHYAGFGRLFRRGPVEEVSVDGFARGRAVRPLPHAAPAFAGAAAVQRARSRLGEDRYRFWTNNCEHLVHWALHGTPRSTQVERLLTGWRGAFGRLAALAPRAGAGRASVSNAMRHEAAETARSSAIEMMQAMEVAP